MSIIYPQGLIPNANPGGGMTAGIVSNRHAVCLDEKGYELGRFSMIDGESARLPSPRMWKIAPSETDRFAQVMCHIETIDPVTGEQISIN